MAKSLAAVEIYDINDIYVSEECLKRRGLRADDLSLAAQAVDAHAIQGLINNADKVVNL